jgi:hypothetical protein
MFVQLTNVLDVCSTMPRESGRSVNWGTATDVAF